MADHERTGLRRLLTAAPNIPYPVVARCWARIRGERNRQALKRMRQGDSLCGLLGFMAATDHEYANSGECHDWPPHVPWGRRTPAGYVPMPDGYGTHAKRTAIIDSE